MCFSAAIVLRKIFLLIGMAVAVAGVVLFFPFNFSGEHTCLLDHIVHAVANGDTPHAHPGELLGRYLIPYGLLWWSSITAVIFLTIVWLRRQTKAGKFLTDKIKEKP